MLRKARCKALPLALWVKSLILPEVLSLIYKVIPVLLPHGVVLLCEAKYIKVIGKCENAI